MKSCAAHHAATNDDYFGSFRQNPALQMNLWYEFMGFSLRATWVSMKGGLSGSVPILEVWDSQRFTSAASGTPHSLSGARVVVQELYVSVARQHRVAVGAMVRTRRRLCRGQLSFGARGPRQIQGLAGAG